MNNRYTYVNSHTNDEKIKKNDFQSSYNIYPIFGGPCVFRIYKLIGTFYISS